MGHSMMPMDFDGYLKCCHLAAAENYDDKVGSTVRANTHRARMHSTSYDTFNNDPDICYDVDTYVDTIMANAHNMVLAYYSNGAHVPDGAGFHSHHATDNIDLIDDVLDQYNVNFATLCANVAKQKNSELITSGKHVHY
jgi:hypothetical protein